MRFLEQLGEIATFKSTSQFQLRINLTSKTFFSIKSLTIAVDGKSLIFTEINTNFDLESDILDMMTINNFNAISIEQPREKNFGWIF